MLGVPLALHVDAANGYLYVPGLYTRAGGMPSFYLGRWLLDDATGTPPAPMPNGLALRVRPNPFNPRTTIAYTLPVGRQVRLDLYDLRGRRVARLAHGPRAAGEHAITWDGRDGTGRELPSGVYLARLVTGGAVTTRKLVLAR
jgi:hypothetical protein